MSKNDLIWITGNNVDVTEIVLTFVFSENTPSHPKDRCSYDVEVFPCDLWRAIRDVSLGESFLRIVHGEPIARYANTTTPVRDGKHVTLILPQRVHHRQQPG